MIAHWARRLVCRVMGHRGRRVITRLDISTFSLGQGVAGHIKEWRWDCSRCGERGYKAAGGEWLR